MILQWQQGTTETRYKRVSYNYSTIYEVMKIDELEIKERLVASSSCFNFINNPYLYYEYVTEFVALSRVNYITDNHKTQHTHVVHFISSSSSSS